MPRITGSPPRVQQPAIANPPAVKAETKKHLKAALETALKSGELEFHAQGMPVGQRFVRVPLKGTKAGDQYQYTALIPVGALAPKVKPSDPNKAKSFFIERSGGLAGITMVAGPVTMGAKGKVTIEPFFSRFLENQHGGGGPIRQTKKAPSDQEDGGAGRPGGGTVHTMKAPSDNEDGGGTRPGGGTIHTMKAPSDNEDGGGTRPGGAVTEKYPSDNEDGGGTRPGGGMHTMKFPSDNEDGGTRPGGTRPGGAVTEKYPSDADE